MATFLNFNNTSSTMGAAATAPDKDVEVGDLPKDDVSCLSFSSQGDFLAVGSWGGNVRVYEIQRQLALTSQGKAEWSHQGPVLDVCWNTEGNKIFSAGADNAARMFDVGSGQATQVAVHDAPIKAVGWVNTPNAGGILATGSWDKTIKYWDLRTSNPVMTVQLPERCYSFDIQYPLMVVGTAERHIQIFDLEKPSAPHKTLMSPLKWQTRVVSCFVMPENPTQPSAPRAIPNGFAVGSIEGRVAIQYVEDKDVANNFSFKCHRRDANPTSKDQSLVYAVNDISFHPKWGTFSTCGADGTIHFWDKDARTRLKTFDTAPGPIVATDFNRDGAIFAYAVSYDWSKGHSGVTAGSPNKVMLHACKDAEVQKRSTTVNRK